MALPITVESVVPASRAAAIASLCQLLSDRLGGFLLVAVPFWIAFGSRHRDGGSGESDAPRAD